MRSRLQTIVILSTADFDAPLWTNKQHLAIGLADHFEVIFINSMGLRQPKFNRNDLRRIKHKIFGSKKLENKNQVKVLNPWILPFHNFMIIRIINELLMSIFCTIKIRNRHKALLWTFSPVTYGLQHYFPKVIYHSVDFLETFPGVSHKIIIDSELQLLKSVDLVFASSTPIKDKLEKFSPCDVILLENVADTSVFYNKNSTRLFDIVFAGNLTPHKINFKLLESLAAEKVQINLAGSESSDGSNSRYLHNLLSNYPNVSYLGELSPSALNELFNKCKIGIVPYKVNSHTEGIYPMKIHEYGAAGLTVVSTGLTSLTNFRGSSEIRVVDDKYFVDEVLKELRLFTPEKSLACSNLSLVKSWKNRINHILEILDLTYGS
jgi:hypothetical protein